MQQRTREETFNPDFFSSVCSQWTLIILSKRDRFDKAFEAIFSPPKPVDRHYDQKTANSNDRVVHVEDVHWVYRR